MTYDLWQQSTAQAVINILDGLAESDWTAEAGEAAWRELVKYRLDLAISVWEGWFERSTEEMDDNNRRAIAEILDKHYSIFEPDAPRFQSRELLQPVPVYKWDVDLHGPDNGDDGFMRVSVQAADLGDAINQTPVREGWQIVKVQRFEEL